MKTNSSITSFCSLGEIFIVATYLNSNLGIRLTEIIDLFGKISVLFARSSITTTTKTRSLLQSNKFECVNQVRMCEYTVCVFRSILDALRFCSSHSLRLPALLLRVSRIHQLKLFEYSLFIHSFDEHPKEIFLNCKQLLWVDFVFKLPSPEILEREVKNFDLHWIGDEPLFSSLVFEIDWIQSRSLRIFFASVMRMYSKEYCRPCRYYATWFWNAQNVKNERPNSEQNISKASTLMNSHQIKSQTIIIITIYGIVRWRNERRRSVKKCMARMRSLVAAATISTRWSRKKRISIRHSEAVCAHVLRMYSISNGSHEFD